MCLRRPISCRRIAGKAALDSPIMGAVNSDNRETAQLSRLIGIMGAQLNKPLIVAVLHAAGALCNFEAGCDVRKKSLAAAASVAAGSSSVEETLVSAIHNASCLEDASFEDFGCAAEVLLTLLEGASIQGRPPADGQCDFVYVTGQHGWVHEERWVLKTARLAVVLGAEGVIRSTAQSPGNLQRKVVLAAALACAPSTYILCAHLSLMQKSVTFVLPLGLLTLE